METENKKNQKYGIATEGSMMVLSLFCSFVSADSLGFMASFSIIIIIAIIIAIMIVLVLSMPPFRFILFSLDFIISEKISEDRKFLLQIVTIFVKPITVPGDEEEMFRKTAEDEGKERIGKRSMKQREMRKEKVETKDINKRRTKGRKEHKKCRKDTEREEKRRKKK